MAVATPTSTSTSTAPTVHLLVSCFGLWGEGKHLKPTEDLILEAWAKQQANEATDPDGPHPVTEFQLLDPEVNASMKTLDGIDLCASRIRDVVLEAIKDLEAEGKKLVRFSMLGYSLGGLIARYLAALLLPELSKRRVKLVNFITIASPAVGIPKYDSWSSSFFIALGSRLLSRSGRQLYAKDHWADTGKPLLENMTTGIFKEALEAFERFEVYASAVNDVTVPFPTAAFEKHDPWAGPLQRARKARSARHAEDTEKINIHDGGLVITLSQDYWPLIETWASLPASGTKKAPPKAPSKWRLPRLPNFLRPSWYPFLPKPARYVVVFGFPVIIPLIFCFFLTRFYIEKHKSTRRVHRLLLESRHQERMHAEGFSSALEEIMEASMPQGPPDSSAVPSRSESPMNSAAAASTGALPKPTSGENASGQQQNDTATTTTKSDKHHQPLWTDAQVRMLDNLATIPQVRKHIAWFPEMRNAHGAIICRHPAFGTDGKMVIQHLADHFVF